MRPKTSRVSFRSRYSRRMACWTGLSEEITSSSLIGRERHRADILSDAGEPGWRSHEKHFFYPSGVDRKHPSGEHGNQADRTGLRINVADPNVYRSAQRQFRLWVHEDRSSQMVVADQS